MGRHPGKDRDRRGPQKVLILGTEIDSKDMQDQRVALTKTSEPNPKKTTGQPFPAHASIHPLLNLQRSVGNQAVLRLMRSGALQPKLAISQPGDVYEQEADRVAEQVMRMPSPTLQRACAPCAAGGPPCPKCQDKKEVLVQRKTEQVADASSASVSDDFLHDLVPGQPLDPTTRTFFEPRFGYDFSRVRVHTDAPAAESARAVNALAFTVDRDIVFEAGHYAPETNRGRTLLAHELAHVVQQRGDSGGASGPTPSRAPAIIRRQATIPDFVDIARRLHDAMSGLGTDEAAIFRGLGQLGGDREAGDELKRVYGNLYGQSLEAELRGELSGADFTRALGLLNPGTGPAAGTPAAGQASHAAQLRARVLSIAKDGNATMSLFQEQASGKLSGYQLHQNFRATFDPSANAADYAIIQWIKGELYETRNGQKAYWPASMGLYGRGASQPWLFNDWVIDTPDADPRFGSNRGAAVSIPTTTFDDAPGVIQNSGTLPAGLDWKVDARVGIYAWGAGVPKYVAGWESQRPQPLRESSWGWRVTVNADQVSLQVTVR